MAYQCIIRFVNKDGAVTRVFRSRILMDHMAVAYAKRMGDIYRNACVSLKYSLVARGDNVTPFSA